jgi:hypothetical protein
MQFLTELWMPIVVSSVLVFFASFLTHMVLPHHKSEFVKLPNEDAVLDSVKSVTPGGYMFPCPGDMKEMNTPEFCEKMKNNPNGVLVVWPGSVNMGRNLGLTFLYYMVVGIFVAYLGHHAIGDTTEYLFRFRLCGTVAFAAHALGWVPFLIWFRVGKFWPNFFDSLAYSLLTAGTFAWLWPHAA